MFLSDMTVLPAMQAACEFGLLSEEYQVTNGLVGLRCRSFTGEGQRLSALVGGDDHRALAALRVRAIR